MQEEPTPRSRFLPARGDRRGEPTRLQYFGSHSCTRGDLYPPEGEKLQPSEVSDGGWSSGNDLPISAGFGGATKYPPLIFKYALTYVPEF